MVNDRANTVSQVPGDAARVQERVAGESVGAAVAVADALLTAFGNVHRTRIHGVCDVVEQRTDRDA